METVFFSGYEPAETQESEKLRAEIDEMERKLTELKMKYTETVAREYRELRRDFDHMIVLTPAEAAVRAHVSAKTITHWAQAGMPHERDGKLYRIHLDDLKAWMMRKYN